MLPVLLAVGGVDHQEIFILDEVIEKRVINGPTGFVGDDCVLCTPLSDVEGFSVIGQNMLKELHCPCAAHDESAHVGDIEEPCPLPGGQVLLHNAPSVPQRHLPACEFHHLGVQGHVSFVENGSLEFAHGSSPFLLVASGRPAALPGDAPAFDEGFQLTQALLNPRRIDARVGQADGEALLSFHGSAKVQSCAHRNAGFVQQSYWRGCSPIQRRLFSSLSRKENLFAFPRWKPESLEPYLG